MSTVGAPEPHSSGSSNAIPCAIDSDDFPSAAKPSAVDVELRKPSPAKQGLPVGQDARPPSPEAENRPTGVGRFRLADLQIVRHFHLSWFAMVMGWGGTALVINGFPHAEGDFKTTLGIIATVVWVWDLVYCGLFLILLLLRVTLYPRDFWKMMKTNSFLFFGCVPMGIAVVGMGFVNFGPHIMSVDMANQAARAIFWIDIMLVIVSMTVPQLMMVMHQKHTFDSMPSLLLLPFVSCVVASALAGTIGPFMPSLSSQQNVNVAGYILWGAGIFTAASIIPVYLMRLVIHGFPPSALGNSVWVVLGPIGQGANAILMLGRNTGELLCTGQLCPGGMVTYGTCFCESAIPLSPLSSLGYAAPGITLLIGFAMWGLGLWWMFMASSASLYHIAKMRTLIRESSKLGKHLSEGCTHCTAPAAQDPPGAAEGDAGKAAAAAGPGAEADPLSMFNDNVVLPAPEKGMPFNLGWWGMVFPFVTLNMSTYQLYIDTQWEFFMWMGRIFAVFLVTVSCYIHVKTVMHVVTVSFWQKFASS
ncbi:uncharacterized protein LOC142356497 [Convolutriloba macropyga]|uniref:uncharacterized protein LOC142356497 n=1 Tax=Convolutriloba macropyga TaxID=536237 RepID=UPI003F524D20